MSFWSVEDGAITGTISPEHKPAMNQYLVWQGGFVGDFELTLEFRLAGEAAKGANGGFQFRSRLLPNGDVGGYQVDNNRDTPWKARLYDEFGRHDLARPGERTTFDVSGRKAVEKFDLAPDAMNFAVEEWHAYRLVAIGPKLSLFVNDRLIAETTDADPQSFEPMGILALQLHTGPPQKAQFRNIRLRRTGGVAPSGTRAALVAEACLHWNLGERMPAHQPVLKPQGTIAPSCDGSRAIMAQAHFDLQVEFNKPRDWNMPGHAMTVFLRALVPDGNWTTALIAKRGSHATCNFNLFSVDLPETPGPDIGFEIHTDAGFFMTSFPVSRIDATAWHDLAGRYDGAKIQILCDGRVMAEKPATGALTANREPLLIGAETEQGRVVRPFTGEMAEAALWTRALTDGELETLKP